MSLDENEVLLVGKQAAKKRGASFPLMEAKLISWFVDQRSRDSISRVMIMTKAQELLRTTNENKNDIFKSSCGWFYGFLKRHKISRRKITHTLQRLPEDFKKKIEEFRKSLATAREEIYSTSGMGTPIVYGNNK